MQHESWQDRRHVRFQHAVWDQWRQWNFEEAWTVSDTIHFKRTQYMHTLNSYSNNISLCIQYNRSQASYEDLEKLLPKDIFHYCRDHRLLDAVICRPSYPPPPPHYPYSNGHEGHIAQPHHGAAPAPAPNGEHKAPPQSQPSRPYPPQQPRYWIELISGVII